LGFRQIESHVHLVSPGYQRPSIAQS
jgi:hypothetical protein